MKKKLLNKLILEITTIEHINLHNPLILMRCLGFRIQFNHDYIAISTSFFTKYIFLAFLKLNYLNNLSFQTFFSPLHVSSFIATTYPSSLSLSISSLDLLLQFPFIPLLLDLYSTVRIFSSFKLQHSMFKLKLLFFLV